MIAWSGLNAWTVAALLARWTVLLTLAWCAHGALVRRNPRWRVILWRATLVGIAGIGLLTLAPPVLTIPVAPPVRAFTAPTHVASTAVRIQEPSVSPDAPGNRVEAVKLETLQHSLVGEAQASRVRIIPTLVALWALVAALLALKLALASFGLGRMVRRAKEVPACVADQCRDVAQTIGAPSVRVVVAAEIGAPCLAGVLRPVILLPDRTLVGDELRAVLAHELAHARGRDLVWNLVAHGATIVLWFHPLAWRLRQAHAAACDAVCDAVAADFLGDVPTYARTLARMALAALAPTPATGLAMARSSDVRRRVDALGRKVFRAPLPRRAVLSAILGSGLLLLLIGGLAVTDARPLDDAKTSPQASTNESTPAADGRFEIQAVAAATGKPLKGAEVAWSLGVDEGRPQNGKKTTDGDGRAVLEWPRGATVNWLSVTVRSAGFEPYRIQWEDRTHPVRPPAVKVVRLAPGSPIGGVVKDEGGKPVAGARITVYAPPNETDRSNVSMDIAEVRTDDQGRWRVADGPVDLNRVSLGIAATGFIRGGGSPSRDLDQVIVLKRGLTVRGRVLDIEGKPVVGAKVRGGDNWSSEPEPVKTDRDGTFVFESFPSGASVVTVTAEGLSPGLKEIHAEDRPILEFRLQPGQVLRGKVVDKQGHPIAKAMVAADTWREHRSLDFRVDTDKDGRFQWRGAPDDAVLFHVVKNGFLRHPIRLTQSADEQVITLDPELVISGRVTDSKTGKPVPRFRLIQGIAFPNGPGVHWMGQEAAEFTDGRYTSKQSDSLAGYAIRIEAAGYKPAESRVFKAGEGTTRFDFALIRAAADDLLSGVVLRPDGRPAAGAEVAISTPSHPLLFDPGYSRFGRGNGISVVKTGPDGGFSFNHPHGPYLLAAMSDDGYAEASPEDVGEAPALKLVAWGKVKGEARIGREPAVNQPISLSLRESRPHQGGVHAFYGIETKTDAQGRFTFDRVIPGTSELARVIITEFGNGSQQHMGCWQEPVEVPAGKTVEVRIGGKGRRVVGRVALKAPPGVHVDWRQNRPATIEKQHVAIQAPGFVPDPRPFDRYASAIDKDGRFQVADVPPGPYELNITIDSPPVQGRPGAAEALASVKVVLNVPEGDDDVPVDIGDIEAEVKGK